MLSIKRENTCKPFIDCGTFSDFSYEREFLFLGGLFPLKITSIRDIPSKANYAPFIQAMSIFQNMIDGKSTRLREPTLSDFRCLLYLMANEIDGWFTLETKRKSNSKIPIFIGNLFKHFALSVAEVKIRLTHFETAGEIEFDEKDIVDWEFGGHRCLYPEQYGLRLFMPLLFDKETQTRPNLELFLSLFSNINKLVIFSTYFHADKMEERYGPSLVLDDDFCNDVLDTIKFMQKKNIKFGLKSIIICNPKSSISEFCETQQEKFTAINWKLYGDLYNHSFYSGTQSLYIAPKD